MRAHPADQGKLPRWREVLECGQHCRKGEERQARSIEGEGHIPEGQTGGNRDEGGHQQEAKGGLKYLKRPREALKGNEKESGENGGTQRSEEVEGDAP